MSALVSLARRPFQEGLVHVRRRGAGGGKWKNGQRGLWHSKWLNNCDLGSEIMPAVRKSGKGRNHIRGQQVLCHAGPRVCAANNGTCGQSFGYAGRDAALQFRGMRRGFSFIELLVVLTLAGLLSVFVLPRLADQLDRLAVRRAVRDASSFYQTARFAALVHSASVRIHFRSDSLVAAYELSRDSVFPSQPGPGQDGG